MCTKHFLVNEILVLAFVKNNLERNFDNSDLVMNSLLTYLYLYP